KELPLKAVVSDVYTAGSVIEFTLEYGGTWYTEFAEIEVTAGTNTSGSGAMFAITSIRDTTPFIYTTEKLTPHGPTELDAEAYGFAFNPEANASTTIMESIDLA